MTAHEILSSNTFIYGYVSYLDTVDEKEKNIVYNYLRYYLSLVPQSVLERLKFDYDEIFVGKDKYALRVPENQIENWDKNGFVLDKGNMTLYLNSDYLKSFNPVCLNMFNRYIYEKSNVRLSEYFQKAYEKERDLIWEIKNWVDEDDKRGFFCQLMGLELTNGWKTVDLNKNSLYSYFFIERLKWYLDNCIKMPVYGSEIDRAIDLVDTEKYYSLIGEKG